LRVPDPELMNRGLQALIIAEYSSLGHSNIGGWHSRPDFVNKLDPAVSSPQKVYESSKAPVSFIHHYSIQLRFSQIGHR
jgi:hypothetical protein